MTPDKRIPEAIFAVKENPDPAALRQAAAQAIAEALEPTSAEPWPQADHWHSTKVDGQVYAAQFDADGIYLYAEDDHRIYTDTVLGFVPKPSWFPYFDADKLPVRVLPNGPAVTAY